MRIGIICEGVTDRAVIINILKGLKKIDSDDITAILPSDQLDETDRALTFSSSSVVKKSCQKGVLFDEFFSLDIENSYLVIHLDTAECEDLDIIRPDKKGDNYSVGLRDNFVKEIKAWLGGKHVDNLLYAIAIEEIEAWVLTIFEKKDSSTHMKPKERLYSVLRKKGERPKPTFQYFKDCSKLFTKEKNFVKGKFRTLNKSLDSFCTEVEEKIPTE